MSSSILRSCEFECDKGTIATILKYDICSDHFTSCMFIVFVNLRTILVLKTVFAFQVAHG